MIFTKKNPTCNKDNKFPSKPKCDWNGILNPPKYKDEMMADEMNILIYSANK